MIKAGLMTLFCCVYVLAQSTNKIASDTEVASDGTLTQYLLHDYNREGRVIGLSSVMLFIRSSDGSTLWEFAAGPDFHWKRGFLNTYIGGTRDGRLAAVAFGEFELPGKLKFIGASDPKFASGANSPPTGWFRRVWIGRDHFFFRWEDLPVRGYGIVTGKIGVETTWSLNKNIQVYSFPNFDYQRKEKGITAGLRIKIH